MKGRAVVIAVDQYRKFDPSGGWDLPRSSEAGKCSAGVLAEAGLEVSVVHNPTGAALREVVGDTLRAARKEGVPAWLVFVGAGATGRDGRLYLCASDTDRALRGAVALDDLALLAANEGPPRIAVTLDCGFTGIGPADEPVRTLTPHARVDDDVRVFRRSDVVMTRPLDAIVPDLDPLLTGVVPVGGVLMQITPTTGGDFIDLRVDGELVGHLRVYGPLDPTVPPPFEPGREYWFWRRATVPWPEHYAMRHNNGAPFGPDDATRWDAFEQVSFGGSSVVTQNPTGRVFRIVRMPGNVEAGFLELHESSGAVTSQTWYAVPGQIDLFGFFLFGDTERLEFTRVPTPALAGRTLHVAVTNAI